MYNEKNYTKKEPFIKINDRVYTKSQIESMTPIEITDIINQVPMAIESCNRVIQKEKHTPGPNSKHKIASARFAKQQLQLSLNWISVIRKKKNVDFNNGVNECFRQAAKETLDQTTFEKVCLRAQALYELNKALKEY